MPSLRNTTFINRLATLAWQLFYLSLIVFPLSSSSQISGKFERLSIQDGLSHSTVFSVIQDKKGFMWFGTQDGGLNKYDGYRFTVFTHDANDTNSIATNNVSKVIEDKSGNIWVGTWGAGLEKYDPLKDQFSHFRNDPNNPKSLSHDNAQTLFEDHAGYIWVGTAGGGLNRLDTKTGDFIVFKYDENNPNSISHDRIWDLAEDKQGNLWIGTGNGLSKLDKERKKFTRYNFIPDQLNGIAHPKVRNVHVDHKGRVWIGTTKGIDILDESTGKFIHLLPYPEDTDQQETNEVNIIYEDHFKHMWVGTHAGGLCRYDENNNRFINYRSKVNDQNSLSYNDVRDICEDRSGILWVTTRGGGINKLYLHPPKFLHFKSDDDLSGLRSNRIRSLFAAANGMVWIGTDGGGLTKFNRKNGTFDSWQHDETKNSISSDRVRVVYKTRDGKIWVGTDGSGLNMLNEETGIFTLMLHSDENSISDDDVLSIIEYPEGIMWIGTDNGLDRYDTQKNSFVHYKNNPDDTTTISNNRIWSLLADSKGFVWAGTDEGLNCIDPETGKIKIYKNDPGEKYSISNNDIFTLFEDSDGNLWVGTGQGLNFFDRKTEEFTTYTSRQGLAGNAVYSIQQDKEGRLWISTINGLSCLDTRSKKFRNYFKYDGLQSNEFNTGSGSAAEDGYLYFGGNNGFNAFNPKLVKDNSYIPEIVFTGFSIFNEYVPIGKDSPLQKSITFTDTITLSYSHSVFSINFAALSYLVSERNQYAYKLEGFDKDWVLSGEKKEATYTNLSPGTYTFRVKASNNDGVWNEKGISLIIIITPPFWRTTWFYILCTIAFLALVFAIIKLRERQLRAEKKILEDKVEQRTEEIKNQNHLLEKQKEELASHNRDITDSIRYAQRIQEAILPPQHVVNENLKDHLIFYKPKDIVSGDFYWVEEHNGKSLVAAVDCTGHGVPGAFVSIVGNSGLNRAVNEFGLTQPSLILDKLNQLVVETLHQHQSEMKDGMDITLCSIDWRTREVQFSGANNSLYLVTQNLKFSEGALEKDGYFLYEIKPDKQPIGGMGYKKTAFTNRRIVLKKGDVIYMFTDGYADQFGGEKGKKFKYAQLKELFLNMHHLPMEEQKQILFNRLEEWKGELEQVDDVCVIGIRL